METYYSPIGSFVKNLPGIPLQICQSTVVHSVERWSSEITAPTIALSESSSRTQSFHLKSIVNKTTIDYQLISYTQQRQNRKIDFPALVFVIPHHRFRWPRQCDPQAACRLNQFFIDSGDMPHGHMRCRTGMEERTELKPAKSCETGSLCFSSSLFFIILSLSFSKF